MIRLARRPSPWITLLERVAFTAICAAIVYIAWRYVPRLPWMLFGASGVVIVGARCGIVMSWRACQCGVPIVEIDRPSLGYGDSAALRVVACGDVGVRLVGECQATKAVDISNYRDTHIATTRCYEEELIRGTAPCTVRVSIPKSPPADGIAWKIVVESAGVAHPYPLRVV
jgi:hypothetical protein